MINFDSIATLLSSVLSRVNMIKACLPDSLQEDADDIITSISLVLKDHNYSINLSDVPDDFFLDMVSLYMELNKISRDLGICVLLSSNDECLEDAACSVSYIMKCMAEFDCVFGYCYKNAKKRVLK